MKKNIVLLIAQFYLCLPVFTQTNRYSTYIPLERSNYAAPQVDYLSILKAREEIQKNKIKSLYAGKIHIYNGLSGHDTYLGCLNCASNDVFSIWNPTGTYGINSTSEDNIWNIVSLFGNPRSRYSPWNPNGTNPPAIVDFEGNFYGYFTANDSNGKRTNIEAYQIMAQNLEYLRENYSKFGN